MITEIIVTIPTKTHEADPMNDRLEVHLARCRLPRCQAAIPLHKAFCTESHRKEFDRKFKNLLTAVRPGRTVQGCLTFEN